MTHSAFNVSPQQVQFQDALAARGIPGSVFTRIANIKTFDSLSSDSKDENWELQVYNCFNDDFDDYKDSSGKIMRTEYSSPSDLWHKMQKHCSIKTEPILHGVTAATPDIYSIPCKDILMNSSAAAGAAAASTSEACVLEPESALATTPVDDLECSGAALEFVADLVLTI